MNYLPPDETVPSKFEKAHTGYRYLHNYCEGDVEKDTYWGQSYCSKCACMVPSNQVRTMVDLDDREAS